MIVGAVVVINKKQKEHVLNGLIKNKEEYGKFYCPCIPSYLYQTDNADDFICKCKEYKETGHCHCGLYE